jgi:hypothetical protein
MAIGDLIGLSESTVIVPYDLDELTLNTSDLLEIDCVENEAPSDAAEPTRLPVEEGVDITDHVKIAPGILTLTVKHSENSLNFDEMIESLVPGRSKDFYNQLLDWKNEAQALVIITPHRLYDKYIITDVSPSWDNTNSKAFAGTISFQEIRKVSTDLVQLSAPPRSKKKKLGVKKIKPVSASKARSALSALSAWSGGG